MMNVKLTIDQIDTIAYIISNQECPLDFECYKSGFEELHGIIMDDNNIVVECTEKNAKKCQRSSPAGVAFICTCPIRRYIAEEFHL